MRDEPRHPHRRALLAAAAAAPVAAWAASAQEEAPAIDTGGGARRVPWPFPSIKVGVATAPAGPTGCTALRFERRHRMVIDVRGGSVVARTTDSLRQRAVAVDALCLTGGSVYGLEAAAGVAAAIREARGGAIDWESIARVPAAAIYDWGLRATTLTPDARFGRAAWEAARAGAVPVGPIGAGAGASCGKWLLGTCAERAGQGAASAALGPARVGVLLVVNALGALYDRSGRVLRGHLDPRTGERRELPRLAGAAREPGGGHTTLSLVVTNLRLEEAGLRDLARQVHASLARPIRPFHSPSDGDVLFAMTTDEVAAAGVNLEEHSQLACELAWDATLSSFATEEPK